MNKVKNYWFLVVFTFPIVGFLINFYIKDIETQKGLLAANQKIEELEKKLEDWEKKLIKHDTKDQLHLQDYWYHKKECPGK